MYSFQFYVMSGEEWKKVRGASTQSGLKKFTNLKSDKFTKFLRHIILFFCTFNTEGFIITSALLILFESIISLQIIWRIPYTEIDWSTYMQQVKCYIKGERNYTRIEGDTGPIVYPAGHLAIYKFLYMWTNQGRNILRAQYIFAGLYLLNLLLVFRLFYKSRRIPPFVLGLICLSSYRIHSIYMLRLFNDPIAMLLFFIAVNLWISQQWLFGCIFYSLGVSVKMNILLFSPAVFFILLLSNCLKSTCLLIFLCGVVQACIASQFILVDPVSYLKRAFEFSRVFFFKWTVNWRFLPESIFLDRRFHFVLLVAHLVLLGIFMVKLWFRSQGGLTILLKRLSYEIRTRLDVHEILIALFTANFAGIVFARSLHYQFYCWYYHSLAYLLFAPIYPTVGPNDEAKSWSLPLLTAVPVLKIVYRIAILLLVELCWNTYPSTIFSSLLLHVCHLAIFVSLLKNRQPLPLDKKVH